MRHLKFSREEPTNERWRPRNAHPIQRPEDPRAHAVGLRASLAAALDRDESVGGFDPRRLLKLEVAPGFQADVLTNIPGIEVISQEGDDLVLAFASDEGLGEFESRLATLARDGSVTRQDILFALRGFDGWRPEDRTGRALASEPLPPERPAVLDVELWPLERLPERARMRGQFETWVAEHEGRILDQIDRGSLVMYRVRVPPGALGALQRLRDVRTIDLPPRLGLEADFLTLELGELEALGAPPDGAPVVGVLDSGIAAGHPLLGAAVGEAAGFLPPDREGHDDNGHGTHVAGICLYGDVLECLRRRRFVPELRLVSGRVFANDGADQTRFVENAIVEAVEYFLATYGCRVFCLAYGDRHKVYDGRHVRGLAYTLDLLSRTLGVLFVVPTGNLAPEELPADPRAEYPGYLFAESSRLLDPAPALNAITVGGVAIFEADANAQRYPDGIESLPIARTGYPAPFTRAGASVRGAIKPDLVAHAGNWAVRRVGNGVSWHRLGVLSLGSEFAAGHLFRETAGTSAAAPAIAYLAARLDGLLAPNGTNLARAILAAHARWPVDSGTLFPDENAPNARKKTFQLFGYGAVDGTRAIDSTEQAVTLVAEDQIANDRHHFYEIPLPEDFWSPGFRQREIAVALAHSPDTRTTRLDYKATALTFRLVRATSLDSVAASFQRARPEGSDSMREYGTGRLAPPKRDRATLQCSTWTFRNARNPGEFRLFVVVTRRDAAWSTVRDDLEPYSLAVVVRDLENGAARLYAQIQDELRLREQARVRQRVRVGGAL